MNVLLRGLYFRPYECPMYAMVTTETVKSGTTHPDSISYLLRDNIRELACPMKDVLVLSFQVLIDDD